MPDCGTGTTSLNNCATFPSADDARSRSLCPATIWSEICAIQQAILSAVDSCQFSVTVSNSSGITTNSFIQSVKVDTAGVDYSTVAGIVTIDHPTGSGADIEPIVTNGTITGFTINSGGTGYVPIVATADTTGVGNEDAVFQVSETDGEIDIVYVLSGGTGYSPGDVISIVHPFGTGANVTVATVGTGGRILSTVVNASGTGYSPIEPTITVTHPTGVGFSGNVLQNSGTIVGISITNSGTNYQLLTPTINVNTSTGSGASFLITVDNITGAVLSVDVVSGGSGYLPTDTINIIPVPGTGGTGAVLSMTVVENTSGLNPIEYFNAWNGITDGELQNSQLKYIINYFECLGYNIQLETNPDTGNTLRWVIRW